MGVQFNSDQIQTNTNLLDGGILPEKATADANEARIKANKEKIESILTRNNKYNEEAPARDKAIQDNRDLIDANAQAIKTRRIDIKTNRTNIMTNSLAVQEQLKVCGSGGNSRGVTDA